MDDKISDGKEYAEVLNWLPAWSIGAPMPQIFSNGNKTFLIYLIAEPDPDWDGRQVRVIDNTSDSDYTLALVEFVNPDTYRFGTVNDEAGGGHPLYSKGLEFYSAHIVRNSIWIEELKSFHKVHPYFKESLWVSKKHFLLFFHDEMFEIIAEDYKIEVFKASFLDLAIEAVSRINS